MNERIRVCKWQPCTDTHWHNTLGYAVVFDHKSNTFVCAFWAGSVWWWIYGSTYCARHPRAHILITPRHTQPKQYKDEQKSNSEAENSWRSFVNIIIAWHYQSVTRYLFATFGTLFWEASHSFFLSFHLAFLLLLSKKFLILFSMLFDVFTAVNVADIRLLLHIFALSSNVGAKVCLLLYGVHDDGEDVISSQTKQKWREENPVWEEKYRVKWEWHTTSE